VARRTGSPQTGLVVTTCAVTFGGRRRLIWTTAEKLKELRPV